MKMSSRRFYSSKLIVYLVDPNLQNLGPIKKKRLYGIINTEINNQAPNQGACVQGQKYWIALSILAFPWNMTYWQYQQGIYKYILSQALRLFWPETPRNHLCILLAVLSAIHYNFIKRRNGCLIMNIYGVWLWIFMDAWLWIFMQLRVFYLSLLSVRLGLDSSRDIYLTAC